MKNIHFIRHSKSSWKHTGVDDIDRPLKGSGIVDAHKLATSLRKRMNSGSRIKVDAIISSDAIRALHTAIILSRQIFDGVTEVIIVPTIYSGKAQEILTEVIHRLPEEFSDIVLVGHDPELTLLVNSLSSESLEKIPTSGLVSLNFAVDKWTMVKRTPRIVKKAKVKMVEQEKRVKTEASALKKSSRAAGTRKVNPVGKKNVVPTKKRIATNGKEGKN